MAYLRFLRDEDYTANIRQEQLEMIAGRPLNRKVIDRAEENSEVKILEYMMNMYEIENAFSVGKSIIERDTRFTYPAGSYLLNGGLILTVTKEIAGQVIPRHEEYWEFLNEAYPNAQPYSQMADYEVGDIVIHKGIIYSCLVDNGKSIGEIVRPGEANKWRIFDVSGMTQHEILAIPEYTTKKNDYALTDVVCYNMVYYIPTTNPNADELVMGSNTEEKDPRSMNLKKHMVQLSLYEMAKRISPNNVSASILADYTDTCAWLSDVSKGKINPMIPRRTSQHISGEERPASTWAMASFSNVNADNAWIV